MQEQQQTRTELNYLKLVIRTKLVEIIVHALEEHFNLKPYG
jgi:hypothetical protein